MIASHYLHWGLFLICVQISITVAAIIMRLPIAMYVDMQLSIYLPQQIYIFTSQMAILTVVQRGLQCGITILFFSFMKKIGVDAAVRLSTCLCNCFQNVVICVSNNKQTELIITIANCLINTIK